MFHIRYYKSLEEAVGQKLRCPAAIYIDGVGSSKYMGEYNEPCIVDANGKLQPVQEN